MLKLLVLVASLLINHNAIADWVQIAESAATTFYVDPSTVRRNGNMAKMWELIDLREAELVLGKAYLSIRSQQEYDCSDERVRTITSTSFSGHMADGKTIFYDPTEGPFRPVEPGRAVNRVLWKYACGKP